MEPQIVRHISLLIICQEVEIPDYFFAFFPTLKNYVHSRKQHEKEIAMEIYINDTLYGTLYKNEYGFYPSLYIPYGSQPATIRMRGVRSGTHYLPTTVPQGTEKCEVVFCEKYPECSGIGRRNAHRKSIDLSSSAVIARVMDAVILELQPGGEVYEMMTHPDVKYTRLAVVDSGVEFHHITDTQNPVYFPGEWVQEFHFDAFNLQDEPKLIALNDSDCVLLQKIAEDTLPQRNDMAHLQFFTEDHCLCLMLKA